MSLRDFFFGSPKPPPPPPSDQELLDKLVSYLFNPCMPPYKGSTLEFLDTIQGRLEQDGKDKHPDLLPVAEILASHSTDKIRNADVLHDILKSGLSRYRYIPENPWKKIIDN